MDIEEWESAAVYKEASLFVWYWISYLAIMWLNYVISEVNVIYEEMLFRESDGEKERKREKKKLSK